MIFSVTGLLVLTPVFILVALLIKYESLGDIFYRGERIGRYGKNFRIYKFRSMMQDAEKTGVNSSGENDQRITKVGKYIRKFKLDEFSQLINVLKGEMSLVGPRPQVLSSLEKFSDEERKTLVLRPGITDWASIKFNDEGEIIARSGIEDADLAYYTLIHPTKMKYQLKYLRERNLFIDIKIIVCTLLTVFSTRFGGKAVGVPCLDEEKKIYKEN